MKKTPLILLFLSVFISTYAQTQSTRISGRVLDDVTKEGIEFTSVRLLNSKDSTYVAGSTTDASGRFLLTVKPAKYILQFTYVGYKTINQNVDAIKNVALGDILMKEDGILLSEAVVTAVAPDIKVKGDTVEYNADSYKVQEGAVLEDLIKKIPGAEIDADGKIRVNGKDISKILVDGKEFFSNDPTTASQNLPAKMVEKLQVLDKKSDMAQLTGFDDGEEETVINLIVKPEMKEGMLSNVLAGYGNKDRYEGNGFINYARNNTRVTLIGNINNTNNANANVRGPGKPGLLTTRELGLNLAGESDRLKYDADVSYSSTDNDVKSVYDMRYVGADRSGSGSSNQRNGNDGFNLRSHIEWKIDSLTKVIFRPNINYSKVDNRLFGNSERIDGVNERNNIRINEHSTSNADTWGFKGNLLLNRMLNNKGRSVTLELSGGNSNGSTDGSSYSLTDYINMKDTTLLDQIYNQDNNSSDWRVRVSYLEPIWRNAEKTKMNFLEVAYNIKGTHSKTDKKTYDFDDLTGDYTDIANDYTRKTVNDFLNQNVTLSFQAKRKKYNYTLGAGLEPSSTKTTTIRPGKDDMVVPRKNYLNFAPRVEFNYLWDRKHNFRFRYDGRTNIPSTNQLFDGIISQNALDTTRGNPNLRPSFKHNFNVRFHKFSPEKASFLMGFANFSYVTNDIATITRWGEGNSRNTTYANIDGNMNGMFRFMYNTPLRNRKFTFNTGTFGNYTKNNTFITNKNSDPQKNWANTYKLGEDLRTKFNTTYSMRGIGGSANPMQFSFDLGANFIFENTNHSLAKEKNGRIYNYGGFGSILLELPFAFTLESEINYSANSGYEGGYKQNMWLWNASLSKLLLKNNATLRFKMYDILHERSNIVRTSNNDNITFTTYNTINSYFMVNFTYRFNSFKGGMKASDMETGDRKYPGYGPPGRMGPPPR